MNETLKFVLVHAISVVACAIVAGCDVNERSAGASSSSSGDASTSSSGTASTSSSGGGSTSSSGGANTCEAAFCDGFESFASGDKPGAPWTVTENSGTVVVDQSRAFSGKQSIKFSTTGSANYKSVLIAHPDVNLLRGGSDIVYGRMMFWLESAPTGDVHWTFIAGEGPVPGQPYRASLRYGGQHPIVNGGTFVGSQLMANYETPDIYATPPVGPATDCWQHSQQKVVPVGKWSCVMWSFDTANDEMRFWLDGTELADLHVIKKGEGCVNQPMDYVWDAPEIAKMYVGWESYQSDDSRTMWIDDVVIDTKPIACP